MTEGSCRRLAQDGLEGRPIPCRCEKNSSRASDDLVESLDSKSKEVLIDEIANPSGQRLRLHRKPTASEVELPHRGTQAAWSATPLPSLVSFSHPFSYPAPS